MLLRLCGRNSRRGRWWWCFSRNSSLSWLCWLFCQIPGTQGDAQRCKHAHGQPHNFRRHAAVPSRWHPLSLRPQQIFKTTKMIKLARLARLTRLSQKCAAAARPSTELAGKAGAERKRTLVLARGDGPQECWCCPQEWLSPRRAFWGEGT